MAAFNRIGSSSEGVSFLNRVSRLSVLTFHHQPASTHYRCVIIWMGVDLDILPKTAITHYRGTFRERLQRIVCRFDLARFMVPALGNRRAPSRL